nr:hypothetical protein [Mycobacterium eburneum]
MLNSAARGRRPRISGGLLQVAARRQRRPRAEAATVREILTHHRRQLGRRLDGQHRSAATEPVVRQPFDPVPRRRTGLVSDHRNQHVVRSMEKRQMNEHRAGGRPGRVLVADQRPRRRSNQTQRPRNIADERMLGQKVVDRLKARRLLVFERTDLQRRIAARRPHHTHTDSDMTELRGSGPALPHAGCADLQRQLIRRRVVEHHRIELRRGRLNRTGSARIDVAHIVGALLGHLAFLLPAAVDEHHQRAGHQHERE